LYTRAAALRQFYVGVSFGDVVSPPAPESAGGMRAGYTVGGAPIPEAEALASACKARRDRSASPVAAVLISHDAWQQLPEQARKAYGPEEEVADAEVGTIKAHYRAAPPA
jgi:hypothetical protein